MNLDTSPQTYYKDMNFKMWKNRTRLTHKLIYIPANLLNFGYPQTFTHSPQEEKKWFNSNTAINFIHFLIRSIVCVISSWHVLFADQNAPPEFDFEASLTDSDEDIPSDGCGSPRMQRKKRPKIFRAKKVDRSITFRTLDELLYNDSLPEVGTKALV